MQPPQPKFLPGTLVRGIPYAVHHKQYPMIGIVIRESSRSNWWGTEYHRWYEILAENGVIVEDVETSIVEVV